MAQYDGSIRINTKIDTQGFKDGEKEIEAESRRAASDVSSSVGKAEKEVESLGQSFSDTAVKIAELQREMQILKFLGVETKEFTDAKKEVEKLEKALGSAYTRKEKFLESGGNESSRTFKNIEYDIEEFERKLKYAQTDVEKLMKMESQMAKLQAARDKEIQQENEKQVKLQAEAAEEERLAQIRENAVVSNNQIVQTVERIRQLEKEIADLKSQGITEGYKDYEDRIQELSRIKRVVKDYNSNIGQAKENYKKLGDVAKQSFSKINKSAKKSGGLLGTMASRFKGLALSLLIFNQISKAFNSITSGTKEGMKNLAQYSSDTNEALSLLMSRSTYLKNALATAFSPIVEVVTPILMRFIELLGGAATRVSELFSALMGKDTFTKAVKVQQDYAESLKDTSKNTKKAAKETEKALAPFDELRQIQFQDEKESEDIKAGELTPDHMFETDKVSDNMNTFADSLRSMGDILATAFDNIKNKAIELKGVFNQGFFDGLGDWEYRWGSIKDSISSIKDSLVDIWTDPSVLSAADGWLDSVAYVLGSLAGSMTSIGLTIATNLLGGIELYLGENKDRIKEYLISMFDIGTEINQMFAELFQSIAYVFEAFASEQGQQLTANLIGMFVDAFMGTTEIVSKLARDILNIFIKPFVENKEEFRVALEGFLGVLSEVTGTIKQGIDDTFDKLNEVYDEHFKPFFDSVANGLSDLVAKFLEFWNTHVQPILEKWAQKFDELWKSHIQPFLNNAADFLGKVADLLKTLWENILQPLIAWIIENVLPKILPVIDAIFTAVEHFVANAADLFNSIITILGGVVDFITGVFSGDWDKAFSGLGDIFGGFIDFILSGIKMFEELGLDLFNIAWEKIKAVFDIGIDAILGIVESFLNWFKENVINKTDDIRQAFENFLSNLKQKWDEAWGTLGDIIGTVVDGIKNTVQSIFDWIIEKIDGIKQKIKDLKNIFKGSDELSYASGESGGQFSRRMSYSPAADILSGISYKIPALATGTVVPPNREFLATLGDNKREPEIVSPISTMKQAFMEAIQESGINLGGGQSGPIYLQLDGKTFARLMGPYTEAEKTRVGVRMVSQNG